MQGTGGKHQKTYIPKELLKEMGKMNSHLVIGIPRERNERERRLALTPEAIDILTDVGHHVLLESGAGQGINYSDIQYAEAGAEIVNSSVDIYHADTILKILPLLPAEAALLKPRATLFSMVQLDLFASASYEALMQKRINAVAYELMNSEQNNFPVRTHISEIEGLAAITIASSMLSNTQGGKGILLGGIPGIAPTEVVIIGAGTAGIAAARAALGMGAAVKIFDNDIHKLRTIQQVLGQKIFTSIFQPKIMHNVFRTADVVIGAIDNFLTRRRYMIAEELIRIMKKGALIIDLCINQGGCFETTCALTSADPEVFEQYDVLHYCKPDISNSVARTTSIAFSNIFVSMLLALGDAGSFSAMIKEDNCFRSGVYLFSGKPVNSYVSSHFNVNSNDLDLYLSAF
jgi:alanine dehydrogenase